MYMLLFFLCYEIVTVKAVEKELQHNYMLVNVLSL